MQVGAKYKDEVPGVSGCNQNIETSYKNKLKLTELNDLCFKRAEKLAKERLIYVTAILKL